MTLQPTSTGPKPVFVLGIQRSGTTWLANILAAHPSVVALTDERHQGVHESLFFSHFANSWGDWQNDSMRRQAITAFMKSDYGVLTGLDMAQALHLPQRSPHEFFLALMGQVAQRSNADVWVEKSPHHTTLATDMALVMRHAHFICVHRKTTDLLRSRLWAYGRQKQRFFARSFSLLRGAASNIYHRRLMQKFAKQFPAQVSEISFEDLRENALQALVPIYHRLDLEIPAHTDTGFAANSSFTTPQKRKAALGVIDRIIIGLMQTILLVTPFSILDGAVRVWTRGRTVRFPRWVWPTNSAIDLPKGAVRET